VEWTKLLLHKNACKERCLLSIVLAGLFFKTPVTLTKREKGTIPQDSSNIFIMKLWHINDLTIGM